MGHGHGDGRGIWPHVCTTCTTCVSNVAARAPARCAHTAAALSYNLALHLPAESPPELWSPLLSGLLSALPVQPDNETVACARAARFPHPARPPTCRPCHAPGQPCAPPATCAPVYASPAPHRVPAPPPRAAPRPRHVPAMCPAAPRARPCARPRLAGGSSARWGSCSSATATTRSASPSLSTPMRRSLPRARARRRARRGALCSRRCACCSSDESLEQHRLLPACASLIHFCCLIYPGDLARPFRPLLGVLCVLVLGFRVPLST
eukprot:3660258-Prymnesium_polylepis.1